MVFDHQGPSGKHLTVETRRHSNIYGDCGAQIDLLGRRFRSRIVSPGYECYCCILLRTAVSYEYSSNTAVYHTYGTLKSSGVYPSNSTTTTKYCCIASGAAVVSYKTALRSTAYHHGGLYERQRQLHQCHQGTEDV